MNDDKYTNITIALCGIFQACALVMQLAWTGKCDNEAFETSMYSLLQVNPTSVISVYQNISNLSLGLTTLIAFFNNTLNNNGNKDTEIIKKLIDIIIHITINNY